MEVNLTHFKLAMEAAPSGIYITDLAGKLVFANPAYRESTGLSLEQLLDKGWSYSIHPDDREKVQQHWCECVATRAPFESVHRLLRPDGTSIWVKAKASLFSDNQGGAGYVGTTEDITMLYESKEELKKEKMLFQKILDYLPIRIFLKDHKLRHIFVNKTFAAEASGFAQKLIGKTNRKIFGARAREWDNLDRKVMETGRPADMEESYTGADGKEKCSYTGLVKIEESASEPFLLGFSLDITERKRYEQELKAAKEKAEQASVAKEQFLSMMSHEIRTPINAVIGITHLLIQENPRPEQLDYLKTLKFSGENLLALINDILDFNKIEAGEIIFEEVNFNLRELVQGIKHSHLYRVQEKGIRLLVRLDAELPDVVAGDSVRLVQILNNLVSNAIKFTEKGKVSVDIMLNSADDKHLVLDFVVSDTGIGIPADKLDYIFERFTQASSDTTRKFGGTGLGLAITKRLLALQGSTIHVESEVGKGSKFFFSLRFKKSSRREVPVSNLSFMNTQKLSGTRLLLVEDNEVNVFVMAKFLSNWQVEFDHAYNGRVALEKIKDNAYDVVLMDLQMPEMDGYEATQHIREWQGGRLSALPIIALTAATTLDVKDRAFKAGIDDYVSKPFNPNELQQKLIKYISRSAKPEENAAVKDGLMVNYQKIIEATLGNEEFIQQFLRLHMTVFEQFADDYQRFMLNRNAEKLYHCIQQIRTSLGMLDVFLLQEEIKRGKALLSNVETNIATLNHSVIRVKQLCRGIIQELKSYLR